MNRLFRSRKFQVMVMGIVATVLSPHLSNWGMTEDQIAQVSETIIWLALGFIGMTALEDSAEKLNKKEK